MPVKQGFKETCPTRLVAELVYFFVSHSSDMITGQNFTKDSGY